MAKLFIKQSRLHLVRQTVYVSHVANILNLNGHNNCIIFITTYSTAIRTNLFHPTQLCTFLHVGFPVVTRELQMTAALVLGEGGEVMFPCNNVMQPSNPMTIGVIQKYWQINSPHLYTAAFN